MFLIYRSTLSIVFQVLVFVHHVLSARKVNRSCFKWPDWLQDSLDKWSLTSLGHSWPEWDRSRALKLPWPPRPWSVYFFVWKYICSIQKHSCWNMVLSCLFIILQFLQSISCAVFQYIKVCKCIHSYDLCCASLSFFLNCCESSTAM